MRSTGIIRRIDDLGRIAIPKEIRRMRNIEEGDPVEIYVDGNVVCLRKYAPGCTICGSSEQLMNVDGVLICRDCGTKVMDKFMEE